VAGAGGIQNLQQNGRTANENGGAETQAAGRPAERRCGRQVNPERSKIRQKQKIQAGPRNGSNGRQAGRHPENVKR